MTNKSYETKSKKALRLESDWGSFVNEHPELTIEEKDGKIINIIFPPEAECKTLILLETIPNNVYALSYIYNGKVAHYEAPEARNSLLYELLNS